MTDSWSIEAQLLPEQVRVVLARAGAILVGSSLVFDTVVVPARGFFGFDPDHDEHGRARPTQHYLSRIGLPQDPAPEPLEELCACLNMYVNTLGELTREQADALARLYEASPNGSSVLTRVAGDGADLPLSLLAGAVEPVAVVERFWARTHHSASGDSSGNLSDGEIATPWSELLTVILSAARMT